MKFTKEQAIESLKRELTNNDRKTLRMSEKTLNKVVEALLPKFTDDETGLPDFIKDALEILNPVNDNIGNDKSAFIKQWNIEHPETKPSEGEDTPQNEVKPSPELEELRNEIAALKAANEKAAKESERATKRKSLIDKIVEKGISDKEWTEMFMAEVDIDKVEDIEAKAESILKFYNKSKAGVNPRAVPGAPSKGEYDDEIPDSIARAKKMAQDLNKLRGEQTKQ